MGYLIILISGLIGAGSVLKKKFLPCWIFLINVCFSLYIGIFLAPLLVPLLEIPGLDEGYKSAIAVGGVFLILDIILQKISEQIFPNSEVELPLPSFTLVFTLLSGFFSGILISAIVIYLFMQTPLAGVISTANNFRAASAKTLMAMVHTMNVFSWQTLSAEGETDLRKLRLLPKLKKPDTGKEKDPAKNDAAADQNKTPADTKAAPAAKPGKKKNPDQKTAPQENKGADQTGKPGKK